MNTLTLNKLEFFGNHGVTKEEQEHRQPFQVDVSVQYDFIPSLHSDILSDTIDYKIIEEVAKKVIEGPSHHLIETLAGSIGDGVLENTDAYAVTVTVTKIRPQSVGTPLITIEKTRTTNQTKTIVELLNFNKETIDAFYSAKSDGILHLKGVLYSVLNQEKLCQWYQKRWALFEKKEEKYIQNNQEVSVVYNGPFMQHRPDSPAQEIALHNLYYKIRSEIAKYSSVPFQQGDRLETKLIKYPVSPLGVGAHKDLSSNINAIVLFNFYGTTNFYTASDKSRSGEKAYRVEPGDIVIMRGPREKQEADLRPIHYVLDIEEERLVFVCREIEDATEAVINKGNWMGF